MGAVVEKRVVVHFGHTIKFKNALALVEAIDILQACLNGVILGKWARPVELKCVLGKGFFGVGGLSSIREWTVKHFAEGIDALHIIMAGREHVTESQHLTGIMQQVLIVDAPMSRVKNGAGNTTDVSTSMQERHNMGRKYLVAFSVVIFNALLVVTFPACLAFLSPAMKSTAIASITAM